MMLRCALLAHWQKTKIAGSLRRASHTITVWKFHGPNTQKALGGVGPWNRHSTEPSHSEWRSRSITASVLTHHGLTLNHLRNARLSHVSLKQEMSNPSILSHPFGWQSIGRLSPVFSYLTYLNITFRVYLTFCDLPHGHTLNEVFASWACESVRNVDRDSRGESQGSYYPKTNTCGIMWHHVARNMKWAGSTIVNLTRMKACQKHVKAMCLWWAREVGHKKTEVYWGWGNQVSGCIRDKQTSPLEPLSSRCSRSPYAPRRRRWKAGPTGWILGGCTELRVYHEKNGHRPRNVLPHKHHKHQKHHKQDITRPKVRREAIRIWHTALRIRRWRNAWAIAQLQLLTSTEKTIHVPFHYFSLTCKSTHQLCNDICTRLHVCTFAVDRAYDWTFDQSPSTSQAKLHCLKVTVQVGLNLTSAHGMCMGRLTTFFQVTRHL